ncbi:MAG: 23S rRNA (guanosine(2251)-2'-O)-methyltransferase RlmB [Vulcanibacillus sp.]
MELIESIHNPRVSLWYQLNSKKGREEQGRFIIEGYKLIEEALTTNQEIEVVIVNNDKDPSDFTDKLIYQNDIKIVNVSNIVFNKLCDTETPQGIIAVVKKKRWEFNELLKDEVNKVLLLIDEIQDPGNLGTIIRSAAAAGVSGIIIGKNTVELHNPKVIRSAMGSIFHVPILINNLDDSIEKLKALKIDLIGTSPYASIDYYNVDLTNNVALVIGNEARGLSEERQASVNKMVRIPIVGNTESLNVAMATTVILFEHLRQRNVF